MSNFLQRVSFKKYKRPTLITLSVLFSLILVTGAVAFFKRDALLKSVVNKAILAAKTKYNLNVKIGEYGFTGLSSVRFQNISVIPEQKDSLAKIQDFTVGVKLFPLLFGKVKISELSIRNALISLIKKDSTSNYDFLFKKSEKDTTQLKPQADLSELANKLLNQALDKIPEDMKVNNFLITFDQDTTHLSLLTETANINNGVVNSTIKLNKNQAVWHVNGTANPSDQHLDLKLFADHQKVTFPYLDRKYHLTLSFDTARSVMTRAEKVRHRFEIDGSWSVKNLLINQPKIAANDIIVKDASIDATILVGENYVALDSSSVVHLGKVAVSPFLKYTVFPHKIYEMKIQTNPQNAQDIFNAFPTGLFESLEGIKVQGKLKYNLNLYLDSSQPDSVKFNSSLTGMDNFKILSFGKANFQKINGAFVYTPYENGKPVRDIIVGPANPNYTPISEISPNLQHALMTSEDPSFYSHHGFVEESIRQSIATNFKAKSFKRGGSTISMQLVKNVFLNRQKNLARKIEEILIVWLIENEHLSTKQRMYEVYLNIIEWGRNVYGIGEAAHYYFGKSPSELTVGESIYLAHIVPKPKASLYAWQSDGTLKPYLIGYYNLIGGLMARRGYVENDSTHYGFYDVRLKESLRAQLAPTDSIPDTLNEDEDNGFFNLNIFKPSVISKDSVAKKEAVVKKSEPIKETPADTTSQIKTAKELRQERRDQRKKQNRKQ